MSDESIKARIRKLLALAADDGAADNEINVALATAQRLMQQHRLSESDVTVDSRSPEQIAKETKYGRTKVWADGEKVPQWYGSLAQVIADFIGTTGVYCDRPQIKRNEKGLVVNDGRGNGVYAAGWQFYGPAEDCELAAELFQEMLLTVVATAQLKWGGRGFRGESLSYGLGFVNGLRQRVNEAKEAVSRETETEKLKYIGTGPAPVTALALIRSNTLIAAKKYHAKQWLRKEAGIKLTTKSATRGYSSFDGGAYASGQADGRSTELTANRTRKLTAQ